MVVRYLDLDLMINGIMDLFLLYLTARLLNISTHGYRMLGGVFLGEFSVILSAYWPASTFLLLSKVLTPLAMVWVSFAPGGRRVFLKRLTLFWILSAGLGGIVFALWGWVEFDGLGSSVFNLGIRNFWVLPLGVLLWWGGQKLWMRWLAKAMQLKTVVYDLGIDFEEDSEPIKVRAMLDTGNQLRDPLTGTPVLLVEEDIAATALPENLRSILQAPWRELEDPWPWLWKADPIWMRTFVFIPYQSVGHQSWLLGIRPHRVFFYSDPEGQEIKATLALVQQSLSPDGEYQALLHPEQVQGSGG
ncbi:sigma-E processing peptidase SpoIIGA [Desulfitobacterium metallireducens]|uniref:Sporulation sigma-E factor-processing peptidase n=1 Tax=Desulfitobacterium metallireducens DSM 15288 TaxID=871968 RepID=W0EA44_9FIRM|nr:sigma-E processing peptidase SpoIIGA [Desulfitobacterium metallireducens]AHF07710.1 peptidase U4 sporulation factor SpoIIGA [Desulfitobacterium metallireducens DSM 15288]